MSATGGGGTSFVRVQLGGAVRHGLLVDDEIALLTHACRADTATGQRIPVDGALLLAPVSPTKIVGVGRNNRAHIAEMGLTVPDRPSIFLKPPSSVCGPHDPILLRPYATDADVWFEAEVALIIGAHARDVSEADALTYVAGYTCANDVSARDLQTDGQGTALAKGQDTFCPLGGSIVPLVDDGPILTRCWVNGDLRQDGSSDDLLFGFREIVSYISGFMTLEPGDVILTGSPPGSGPIQDGDVVRIAVGSAGPLSNPVRAVA